MTLTLLSWTIPITPWTFFVPNSRPSKNHDCAREIEGLLFYYLKLLSHGTNKVKAEDTNMAFIPLL